MKKSQIFYYITKNDELIWAGNYLFDTDELALNRLKETYEDVKSKCEIINFDGKNLEFVSEGENHKMFFKE